MSKYISKNEDYVEAGLENIFSVSLLSEENAKKLASLKEALKRVWKEERVWRTETEMRHSVLDDVRHPTKGMKYLQARREQDVFFTNLMYLSTEYDEKRGELMVLEAELEELQAMEPSKKKDGLILQKEAKIRRAQWNLLEMEKHGHHRVRELETWEKIKNELDDGSFDPADYDSIQKEGLKMRFAQQIANTNKPNPAIVGAYKSMTKQHGNENS